MNNSLATGRSFRTLSLSDEATRECLVIEVDTSLTAAGVARVLRRGRWTSSCPTGDPHRQWLGVHSRARAARAASRTAAAPGTGHHTPAQPPSHQRSVLYARRRYLCCWTAGAPGAALRCPTQSRSPCCRAPRGGSLGPVRRCPSRTAASRRSGVRPATRSQLRQRGWWPCARPPGTKSVIVSRPHSASAPLVACPLHEPRAPHTLAASKASGFVLVLTQVRVVRLPV